MSRDLRLQMLEVVADNLAQPEPTDDRVKMSDANRARMAARGLQFDLPPGPLPVICLDPVLHLAGAPECDDAECCCHALEYERIAAEYEATKPRRRSARRHIERNYEDERQRNDAPLNGNRPFKLMR